MYALSFSNIVALSPLTNVLQLSIKLQRGNLVTEETILQHFAKYGQVTDVFVKYSSFNKVRKPQLHYLALPSFFTYALHAPHCCCSIRMLMHLIS